MELKNFLKTSPINCWGIVFASLIVICGVFAFGGNHIHDAVCKHVQSSSVTTVEYQDRLICCLPRRCVNNDTVYELYLQSGFFNDNTHVRALTVVTEDIFPDKDLIAVVSGLDENLSRAHFAQIPDTGLRDGESVIVSW